MKKTNAYKELLQRVTDIYSGAQGSLWKDEDFATAEILSHVVPVLHMIYDPADRFPFCWKYYAIKNFDRPEMAADFIFENYFK